MQTNLISYSSLKWLGAKPTAEFPTNEKPTWWPSRSGPYGWDMTAQARYLLLPSAILKDGGRSAGSWYSKSYLYHLVSRSNDDNDDNDDACAILKQHKNKNSLK